MNIFEIGAHLARGIPDEDSLTELDMNRIQARSLMSFITEWKSVGLPQDIFLSPTNSEPALSKPERTSTPLTDERLKHHRQLENAFATARLPRNATDEAQKSLNNLIEESTHADPLAAAYLSYLHHEGCPVLAQNVSEAHRFAAQCLPWLQFASAEGDPFAQCMLGAFYHLGNGVTQSFDEATKYFSLAADQGHAEGQVMLARAHLSGRGALQNDTRAFELYSLAAKQGHVEANYKTGLCIYNGWGFTRPLSPPRPDDGHFDSDWEYLRDHISVSEDTEGTDNAETESYIDWDYSEAYLMALPFFKFAADKGHREAAFLVGHYYDVYTDCLNDDEGVYGLRKEEEFKYFKIAADLGHCEAQYETGLAYHFNTTPDAALALHYFKLAAAQGHQYAMSKCADRYLAEGSDYNQEEGLRYLHLAAEQGGVLQSASLLARRYEKGDGVEKHLGTASDYYRRGLEYWWFDSDREGDWEKLVRLEAEGYTTTVYSRFWH